jgi:TonB family protein
MFNKLVVSTNEKRGNRTARFFFGTSVIYLIAVACAFAISILIANPQMADTSKITLIAPSPPPPLARPDVGPPRHEAPAAPREDPNFVRSLDDIINHPDHAPAEARHAGPPGTGAIGPVGGVTGGSEYGVPEGIGRATGVPEGHDGEVAPAPRPPDPPRPTTQADNKQPLRLTSTVLQGKASVRRTPDYPPLAKQIRLEGSVSVEVMIAPDGHVESARAVSSSHPMFVKAAVDSAYGWRFQPTTLNGTPVRVTGIIVFNFKLN